MAKARIVIVADDDTDVRECLATFLREEGYRVCVAKDGRETLALLHMMGDERCVLVMDLMMPTVSGFDVLQLLANEGRLTALPVIVCSASRLDPRPAGIRHVLKKPFDIDELLPRVAAASRERTSAVPTAAPEHEGALDGGPSLSDGLFDVMCAVLALDEKLMHEGAPSDARAIRLTRVRTVLSSWGEGGITADGAERKLRALLQAWNGSEGWGFNAAPNESS